MKKLVDRDKAIEKLNELKAKREKSCSMSSVYEVNALNYAIEIIKKLPVENADGMEQRG